nr:unnamed protein product [Callosobruchus analis]
MCSSNSRLRFMLKAWRLSRGAPYAFELFSSAANIETPEKKRATLLHSGGLSLQEIYYNLPGAHFDSPADLPIDVYKVAIEKLDVYFSPKQSRVYERHLFRLIKQDVEEKFENFLVRLRHQSTKCNFSNEEEHLIDQITEKCISTELRKKISTLGDSVTLDQIIVEANAIEAVDSQMSHFVLNHVEVASITATIAVAPQKRSNVIGVDIKVIFKANVEREQWNARSFQANRHSFNQLQVEEEFDIALISETWFKSTHNINLKHFNVIRKDRANASGGVAIFISKALSYEIITFSNNFNQDIEVCGINALMDSYKISVISLYRPPNIRATSQDYINIFRHAKYDCIVGGDFNAHHGLWGSPITSTAGNILADALDSFQDYVVVNDGSATRMSPPETTLKVLIHKKESIFATLQTLLDVSRNLSDVGNKRKFKALYQEMDIVKKDLFDVIEQIQMMSLELDEGYTPDFKIIPTINKICGTIRAAALSLKLNSASSSGAEEAHGEGNNVPSRSSILINSKHDNPNLNKSDKIHYLIGRLKGPALTVCSGIEATGENYEIIWNALIDRYHDKRFLANSYLEQILDFIPLRNDSPKDLGTFLERVDSAVAALKKLDLPDLSDSISFYLTRSKLDSEMMKCFDNLKRATRIPTTENSLSRFCIFCKGQNHLIASCKKFRNLTPDARYTTVKNNNWCYRCLSIKHMVRDCSSNKKCSVCSLNHHFLLHLGKKENNEI